MKTHTYNEDQKLLVTSERVMDADGQVVFEEVTCETSVALPKLEPGSYEAQIEGSRPALAV